MRKPAILLLDEATSAFDAITERQEQKALKQLKCTRIMIAHRLGTIIHADVILVMREGRLVERGTHTKLLAKGGIYTKLVKSIAFKFFPQQLEPITVPVR